MKLVTLEPLKKLFLDTKRRQDTVWKFHDFSVIQILREINFGDSTRLKIAILGALKVIYLVHFSLQKMQKFIKLTIQSLYI